MIRTVEAVIDEKGNVRLLETVRSTRDTPGTRIDFRRGAIRGD